MPPSRLAHKVLRVARILEQYLGIPRQPRKLPPPLNMLIATILSQNTNDKNSHRAYTSLRRNFPRWEDVAGADMKTLIAAIRTGGMANQKAKRIVETLAAIKQRYGSFTLRALAKRTDDEVIEELTQLKGIGFKTASCVLLFSLGRDVFPVDTHVHRICNRLGLVATRTPEQTYHAMKDLLPHGKGYSFHTNLIRFGRKVCRSVHPACAACPLYGECRFEGKRRMKHQPEASRADHDFMLLDHV